MADTFTTPNMTLVLPVVLTRTGPLWASDLNTAMSGVDAHDHSSGKGVAVTPAGLSINADLTFGGNNVTHLRTARFDAQSANPSGVADLLCVYSDAAGNLWWNNLSGTQVQITNGGTINSSALVANTLEEVSVSTNLVINPASSYVSLLVDTTASRTITLPTAAGVAAGRYYIVKDVTGTANTNHIVMSPQGSDTLDGVNASLTYKSNFGSWQFESDGVSRWFVRYLGGDVSPGVAGPTGAAAAGNALLASSSSQSTWGPINLAGGSNCVTGVLPAANLGQASGVQSGAIALLQDFGGTATAPTVVNVSGVAGLGLTLGSAGPSLISLGAAAVVWSASTSSPSVGILARGTTGAPTRVKFYGQDAFSGGGATAAAGGGVDYFSGSSFGATSGDANVNGDHKFKVGPNTMLHVAEVATGRSVVALGNSVAASDVADGNRVTWLANANVAPSTASATGALMFASSGIFGFLSNGGKVVKIKGDTWGTFGPGALAMPTTCDLFLGINVDGTDYLIPLVHHP